MTSQKSEYILEQVNMYLNQLNEAGYFSKLEWDQLIELDGTIHQRHRTFESTPKKGEFFEEDLISFDSVEENTSVSAINEAECPSLSGTISCPLDEYLISKLKQPSAVSSISQNKERTMVDKASPEYKEKARALEYKNKAFEDNIDAWENSRGLLVYRQRTTDPSAQDVEEHGDKLGEVETSNSQDWNEEFTANTLFSTVTRPTSKLSRPASTEEKKAIINRSPRATAKVLVNTERKSTNPSIFTCWYWVHPKGKGCRFTAEHCWDAHTLFDVDGRKLPMRGRPSKVVLSNHN